MGNNFNTEVQARNYIEMQTQGFQRLSPTISMIFHSPSEEILKQEHFSFYDSNSNSRYHFSLLERPNNFEVTSTQQKMSRLVYACEVGDIHLFNKTILSTNNEKTLALAFNVAIFHDHLNLVKLFINNNYISNGHIYENPIITATVKDSINSFLFLLPKYEIPSNILAHILRHNSKNILNYIFQSKQLSESILCSKFQNTGWVQRLLTIPEYNNETIEIYRKHLMEGK